MEKIVTFQPHTSLVIDTDNVHRGVYLGLGFGLIMTALLAPPITTTWFAIANGVGLSLVFLAILGKRLIPVMEGSRFIHEPRAVTNTVGLLLGLGLSIAAIASPPVATIWAAYAHLAAIALVTQAILGYECLMGVSSISNSSGNPVDINIAQASNDSFNTDVHKAA